MRVDEVVIREPQPPREAEHQFLRHGLYVVHELDAVAFELRQDVLGDPRVGHVGSELQLVALFLIRGARAGSDLALFLPPDVLGRPGHGGFDGVR